MRYLGIVCLFLASGCGRSLLPDEMQGDWRFEEQRYLDEMQQKMKSPEEFARFRTMYDQMKAAGAPMRTDVNIRGDRIIGQGAILQDQFDILELRRDGDRLVCKVLWHEDRHDPGDCSEEEMVFAVKGDELLFWMAYNPDVVPYRFVRKK